MKIDREEAVEQTPVRQAQGRLTRGKSFDRVLAQISTGLSANASNLHRSELEQLGRRASAACECRAMLADLKERLAHRTALQPHTGLLMARVELPSQAA